MINTVTLFPHMKTICQNRPYSGLCSSGMLQGTGTLLVTNTLSHRNEDAQMHCGGSLKSQRSKSIQPN